MKHNKSGKYSMIKNVYVCTKRAGSSGLARRSTPDSDTFDTDPDPAFHFDADPDPAFQFDTDPDPTV
jgi:hypothetical protein